MKTGPISRYFKAAKAAGRPIQPWEYEAATKGSLKSDMAHQAANRALATSQASQAETEKFDTSSIEQQVLNREQTQTIANENRAASQATSDAVIFHSGQRGLLLFHMKMLPRCRHRSTNGSLIPVRRDSPRWSNGPVVARNVN